jgi:5'-3' exonuclease
MNNVVLSAVGSNGRSTQRENACRRVSLVDGSNLIHRLFHTPRGLNGLADRLHVQLVAIEKATQAKRMVVAFDAPGESWRRAKYPQYKAQRPNKAEGLQDAIDSIVDRLTREDRWEVGYQAGVEADDIIASNCQHAIEVGFQTVIVSNDRDLYQLLSEGYVTQLVAFNTDRGSLINAEWTTYRRFLDEFGFQPSQWPTYRAICGDKSDNVAGVAGINKKGAQDLMQLYPTIEAAIEHRWSLPLTNKQVTALVNSVNSGQFAIMREVCTVRRDVCEEVDA